MAYPYLPHPDDESNIGLLATALIASTIVSAIIGVLFGINYLVGIFHK